MPALGPPTCCILIMLKCTHHLFVCPCTNSCLAQDRKKKRSREGGLSEGGHVSILRVGKGCLAGLPILKDKEVYPCPQEDTELNSVALHRENGVSLSFLPRPERT